MFQEQYSKKEKQAETQQFMYVINWSSEVSHEKYGDANKQLSDIIVRHSCVEVIFGSIDFYGIVMCSEYL